MTTSLSEIVEHYQRNILKCQNDEKRLLHCINKLYKLPIKMEHLQQTGVGKTVNSLRKFDGEIGVAAKALVAKWKSVVVLEEENSKTCQDNALMSNEMPHNIVSSQVCPNKYSVKAKSPNLEEYKDAERHRVTNHNSEKKSKDNDHSKKSKSSPKKEERNHHTKEVVSEKHHMKPPQNLLKDTLSSSSTYSSNNRDSKHFKKDDSDEKHKRRSKPETKSTELLQSRLPNHTSGNTNKEPSIKRRHHNNETLSDETKARKKVKTENSKSLLHSDNNNGIDSSMGANFNDVLGMLDMPVKSSKIKSKPTTITNASISKCRIEEKPHLLSPAVKLEPLDPSIHLELPHISTNYKPMPTNQTVMSCVFNGSNLRESKPLPRTFDDAEALSLGISSKTMRTKVYSGVKTGQTFQVPSLFDLCTRVMQKNIDAFEYTGGVPFEVLKHVLERATPSQLENFEHYNSYLLEDTDILWQTHVQRTFRTEKRLSDESWREMYLRCHQNQERRLNYLAESIKQSQQKIAAPIRKTQLAYMDSAVKPPRGIKKKQDIFGTKSQLIVTPAARVPALSSITPNAVKSNDARLRANSFRSEPSHSATSTKPKKAPLMMKTLQSIRGFHKR